MKAEKWQLYLAILVFAFFVSTVPWLGLKKFYSRGEAREALVAFSIFNSGNWILPSGYGEAIPSKPPFLHWLVAATAKVLGEFNEFAARAPSAIGSLIFIVFFYLFLMPYREPKQALLAGLILGSSIEWARAAGTCRVDLIFSVTLAAALLCFFSKYKSSTESGNSHQIWPDLLGTIFLSAAVLSKGPVALILFCGVIGVFLFLEWRCKKNYLKKTLIISVLIWIVIALITSGIWYFLAYQLGGEPFLHKIYQENVARFLGTMEEEAHRHGFFYIWGMALLGLLPWSPILVVGSGRLWKSPSDNLRRFCAVVVLVVVVFFSLPSSKRGVYLLPMYPFAALLIADCLKVAQRGLLIDRVYSIINLFFAFVLPLAIVALVFFPNLLILSPEGEFFIKLANRYLASHPMEIAGIFLVAILTALVTFGIYPREKVIPPLYLTLTLCFCLNTYLNASLFPYFASSISYSGVAEEIAPKINNQPRKLYSFGSEFYGLSIALNRPLYRLEDYTLADSGIVLLYLADEKSFREFLGKRKADFIFETSRSVVKGAHPLRVYLLQPIATNDSGSS